MLGTCVNFQSGRKRLANAERREKKSPPSEMTNDTKRKKDKKFHLVRPRRPVR